METAKTTGALDLGPWEIGELRCVAFPQNPLPDAPSTHGSVESGSFADGGRLTRASRPDGAVQWVLDKVPASDNPKSFLLNRDALTAFKDLVPRLLETLPPIRRLAFGGVLFLQVMNRAHAYEVLEKYLHLGLKYSDQEGDFFYQYNRRRWSKRVPKIQINRLTRWTWVPLAEVRIVDGKLEPPRDSACRLEVDINTAPEFQGTIPRERVAPLFEELISLAAEITAQGDVP
jgi:hypothetical protein